MYIAIAIGVAYAVIVVIGFLIAIADKDHGFWWRLSCTVGMWIPVGIKDHASGVFSFNVPLWVLLLTPIGPFYALMFIPSVPVEWLWLFAPIAPALYVIGAPFRRRGWRRKH